MIRKHSMQLVHSLVGIERITEIPLAVPITVFCLNSTEFTIRNMICNPGAGGAVGAWFPQRSRRIAASNYYAQIRPDRTLRRLQF